MKIFTLFIAMIVLMYGCKTTQQKTSDIKESMPPPVLTENQKQQLAEGIDFYAKGSIPASWTLEMDWGNIIRFRAIDGTETNSTPVQGVKLVTGNGKRYTTLSSYGEMIIDVTDAPCTNSITGEKYGKTILVSINNKKYEGCGDYLFNPALDGKWVVVKIDNTELVASDFAKGLPEINIDLALQQASGNDGCNSFSSDLEILGNKIKFSAIKSTKMACPSNNAASGLLQKLEGHFSGYSFNEGKLVLYLYDDSNVYLKRM